jgi:hypothetical protein
MANVLARRADAAEESAVCIGAILLLLAGVSSGIDSRRTDGGTDPSPR